MITYWDIKDITKAHVQVQNELEKEMGDTTKKGR